MARRYIIHRVIIRWYILRIGTVTVYETRLIWIREVCEMIIGVSVTVGIVN